MDLLKIAGLLVFMVAFTDSQVCFKKFVERKNRCKGPIKRGRYESASACCSSKKGVGFAMKKEKKGRNLYKCTPCSAFDKQETRPPAPEHKETPTERVTKPTLPGWTGWGACSVSCGAGWRSRVRLCEGCVNTDPRNMQVHPCIEKYYCPVDGNWGPWYPWQACSASCDGGEQVRYRHCNYPPPSHGGKNCKGKADGQRECNSQGCPVDGNWGEWSRFSHCSVTCGRGTITRTRLCNNPEPTSGGKGCTGSRYEQKRCANRLCPLDGGWSLWGEWSACSVTCGTGIRSRSRECDSPHPRYGGKECKGQEQDDQKCKGNRPCAVDGGWTAWTSYTSCNAPRCTGKAGERIRTRSCTNPRPRFGGRYCKGPLFSSIECINNDGCPVDGSWCRWSEWSSCIATCKSQFNHLAYERRERTCACPLSKNGGQRCDIDGSTGFQVRECKGVPMCQDPRGVLPEQKSKAGCKKDAVGSGDGSDISCDQEDDSAESWSGSGSVPQAEEEKT